MNITRDFLNSQLRRFQYIFWVKVFILFLSCLLICAPLEQCSLLWFYLYCALKAKASGKTRYLYPVLISASNLFLGLFFFFCSLYGCIASGWLACLQNTRQPLYESCLTVDSTCKVISLKCGGQKSGDTSQLWKAMCPKDLYRSCLYHQ